jgi:SWI/SNF-related matrix-associated actin-dependent regulator of chromatin subfamily A member 5
MLEGACFASRPLRAPLRARPSNSARGRLFAPPERAPACLLPLCARRIPSLSSLLPLTFAVAGADEVDDPVAVAVVKREQERQLAKEQKAIQVKRMEKLKELRVEQAQKAAAAAGANAEKRLEFLMQQAEVFTHFIGGEKKADKGGAGAGAGAGGAKAKRGRPAKDDKEDETLADDAGTGVKVSAQPACVTGKMREYQIEGLDWLVNLHDNNISGILADEMGLGKTLQSISLVGYLRETRNVKGPHLVLVPKSVLGNWCREFAKWCPCVKVLKMFGQDKEERLRIVREDLMGGDWDVCVTTFETVCKERAAFKKFPWYYVIIDEAHRIKNENSVLSLTVRALETQYRLLLTGTPLQNNLHELWALLNFLLPDVFGSSEDFDTWFNPGKGAGGPKGDKSGDMEVIKRLHAVIKPFLLRRLKRDVESSLLPKIETKIYIGLTALQKQWYRSILLKDAGALNAIGGPERMRLLNTLMQLRKVCNHPYLFDGAEPGPPYFDGPHLWENCGKLFLMQKLLPKLKASGSRVLIFCQMTRLLDILEDFCRLQNYQYCRIDGNTDSVDRDSQMDVYNAPGSEKFIFLLSTRAGGLGINLYTADVVILYDSDWNPQMDLQAMDRAHRIGQKKQVRVFRLVTDKTVEEKIVERAERKLFLDAIVIQQGRLAQQEKGLSKGELMSMVRFGADEIVKSGDGATITDEDVDKILAQSEARSKQASDKLKKEMTDQMGAFSLEDLLKTRVRGRALPPRGDFSHSPLPAAIRASSCTQRMTWPMAWAAARAAASSSPCPSARRSE